VGQTDEERMRQAIAAAAAVRRLVSPRPWVGAVVVPVNEPDHRGFEGATQGRDGPHAEVVALRAAGARARGATLYTTLEPCCFHGRTGPCTDAVIEAEVGRVVVGITDPDRNVSGIGIERLREAGIRVEVGVCAGEVTDQLRPYLAHRTTGRPYVVLKLAATLDGRTAAPDGTSQWITGEAARLDAHRLRADSDAILVGAGTVRADDPALTVRLPAGEADEVEPLRVVLGKAADDAAVHPALEVTGELSQILDDLGARGVIQLLVEGGATVAHDFHVSGLVDRYVVYVAPALFSGDDAQPMFVGKGAPTIDEVWRGRLLDVRRLGDDVRFELEPTHGSEVVD
jgi:diaminohydroxyphosphoribosylaminopyrimidine deaminase/5-amino-6-(5-phosphoribosylamino)uracil reductase